uniref:Uncharacterized protein n=1 Tax=Sphaerodactylus townsendi TaxID=933632 RepID=A0ACB8FGR5_9SAUR
MPKELGRRRARLGAKPLRISFVLRPLRQNVAGAWGHLCPARLLQRRSMRSPGLHAGGPGQGVREGGRKALKPPPSDGFAGGGDQNIPSFAFL